MKKEIENLIRSHYRDLKGYVSAGMEVEKNDSLIFMNANENPFELPELEGFNRYPKPQPPELLTAYADIYGVKPEHVVATRGADEAIVTLVKLFCEPQSKTGQDAILINPPTFGMYGVDARAMPAPVIEVPLLREGNNFTLDKDSIIAASKNAKLIFICSPNNPTGNSFDHGVIAEICTATAGQSIVVLDETYAEFSEVGSMSAKLETIPNLIILRTLSKSYALAGMRMGCMLCGDSDFTALVKSKALDAYPLPLESIKAAMTAMAQKDVAMANIQTLISERKRIENALRENALIHTIFKSDANFLLLEMDRAAYFIAFAKTKNVILRDFSSKPETKNCIRISIGTPAQNDLVLDLFDSLPT